MPFRYSLRQLMLAYLTICGAMGVWFLNSPWKHVGIFPRASLPPLPSGIDPSRSPDGTRQFAVYKCVDRMAMTILDKNGNDLFVFPGSHTGSGFTDDDTIMRFYGNWPDEKIEPDDYYEVWRRRYPEWWWGHFYRPEVWLTIIFGSLWFWGVVGWFRRRRRLAGKTPSCPIESVGNSGSGPPVPPKGNVSSEGSPTVATARGTGDSGNATP
jgi:hypothetical protein